jgi:hypothetical protein
MSTSTFQTATACMQKLDPSKRVNYTFGLVLGVEEFLQTDAYFLEKHHVENRLLHGYGTMCGLDVVAVTSPQLELQVTPGWAVNPKGQEIHVSQVMCVRVNDWLQANLAALQSIFPSAPSSLALCVVLCYRECKTDVVPIPGEPCRTQSDSMAPSRIADSFELMLCLDPGEQTSPPLGSPLSGSATGLCVAPPSQVEEDAIRAFGQLLAQFEINSTTPSLTLSQVEDLVRALASVSSPPNSWPPPSSPPSGPPYVIHPQDAREFLRAAYRTWVTEVRPALATNQGVGPCCAPPEKCVLLAELTLALDPAWFATAIAVDDSKRPFLVPTRLLQEVAFAEMGSASGYGPVAAGFFTTAGGAKGPTFNNLTATPTSPGSSEFVLNFSGYLPPLPTSNFGYIVKATFQGFPSAANVAASLEFLSFTPQGIHVRIDTIGPGNIPIPQSGFMVEISQIGGGL